MKKMLCILLAVLLLSSFSKYRFEEVKDDPLKTRIYTLKNGLKVYLSVNDEKPRIQTYIVVRTGSKNDPAETTGLAHYLEHLMFKGTDKYGVTDPKAEAPLLADIEQRYEKYRQLKDSDARRRAYHEIDSVSQLAARYFIPNEYDKMMSHIGAEGTNANTWHDRTCYVEDIPSNQVEAWLKIEADRFKNMTIRGFHTELEAVYEEYNIYLTDDNEKMYNAMMTKLFPSHAYGTQTTIGTQEHLKNPSITNIKNYFKKWYVPNNTAICMAGDFNPDAVIALIDKYFGDWQPASEADIQQPSFPVQPVLTAAVDTTVVGQEAEQLLLGWRFDKASSLQSDTLLVVEYMLNNGVAGLIDLDINQQMKMQRAEASTEMLLDYSTFQLGGTPRQGQTLDEVRSLLLAEVAKLKSGDFSDDLLPSVINNLKLREFEAMEHNNSRTSAFLSAFVNGTPWEQRVRKFDRVSGITKQQIIDFVNRHFRDNYVAVYKRQGTDPNQKKIDKPEITAIPTNRDAVSQFVQEIQQMEVKPIEPRFVDFQRDLTFTTADNGSPIVYVQNTENGRFQLYFRYDFGEDADIRYYYAADYLDYLGTDSLSAEQVRQQFYKLACHYGVNVEERTVTVFLSGLAKNMPQALTLLDHLMHHAKVDKAAYQQYIAVHDKKLTDRKFNQQTNFGALAQYGLYGPYNSMRNLMTARQLEATDPQVLLDLLKGLDQYQHSILYYGPLTTTELATTVAKGQPLAKTLKPVPQGRHYTMQLTPKNEVMIAPYDAKNIYMMLMHIEDQPWRVDDAAVKAIFNEYYGGSMGSVVFQEIRESRGLAYHANAVFSDRKYPDLQDQALVLIVTQNDKLMDCVRQFHHILDTIPQNEGSFQIAKEAVKKKIASNRTTKSALISAWLLARNMNIDYDLNQRIYEQLPDVTLKDVVRFEQEHMARKPYRYVILGDERELDMKSLEQIAPVKRLSTTEIFGY